MSEEASPEPSADAAAASATADDGGSEGYGGLLGAFPYAFRRSESRLFRAYALVGGLLAVLVALLFGLALVTWVANTLRAPASVTLSRAFLVVVGLAVFAPLVTPVLLVARQHRRGDGDALYDAAIGGCGFLFVVAGYLGLVLATPDRFLTGTARVGGAVPPLLAILLLVLVHRRLR